eukprot:6212482-Prymnesium_polylepis.1
MIREVILLHDVFVGEPKSSQVKSSQVKSSLWLAFFPWRVRPTRRPRRDRWPAAPSWPASAPGAHRSTRASGFPHATKPTF